MSDLLNVEQLAERLGMKVNAVKRLARLDLIPAIRPTPRIVRFHLRTYLNRCVPDNKYAGRSLASEIPISPCTSESDREEATMILP
jgi:hypothetical protein